VREGLLAGKSVWRSSRGQSSVEFALILPVLFMLVLGVFDLGRGVLAYNVLAEATREGARFAVVHGSLSPSPVGPAPDSAEIAERVRSYATSLNTDDLTVHSSWPDGGNSRGNRVRVEVQYQFKLVSLMPLGHVEIPLRASSEMVIAH